MHPNGILHFVHQLMGDEYAKCAFQESDTHPMEYMRITCGVLCRVVPWCSADDAVCAAPSGPARAHHAGARVRESIAFIGGKYLEDGQWKLIPETQFVQLLDTATGSMQTVVPAADDCSWPHPRAGSSLAVFNDRLLVMFGGQVLTSLQVAGAKSAR